MEDPNAANLDIATRATRRERRHELLLEVVERRRGLDGGGALGFAGRVGCVEGGDGGEGEVGAGDEGRAEVDLGGAVGEVGGVWNEEVNGSAGGRREGTYCRKT